jgi:hypothetical protein
LHQGFDLGVGTEWDIVHICRKGPTHLVLSGKGLVREYQQGGFLIPRQVSWEWVLKEMAQQAGHVPDAK